MIVLDNIIFELQQVGGVSKYWSKTISKIDESREDILFLEGGNAQNNFFRKYLNLKSSVMHDRGPHQVRRVINPNIKCDLFHSSYYRINKSAHFNVATIHDFMNELFPESPKDFFLAKQKKYACRKADMIITVSEKTRSDLLKFYPEVDPSKVKVLYNGVGNEFFPESSKSLFKIQNISILPRSYLLYVGTRGSCKNFPYALKFYSKANKALRNISFIIVGGGKFSNKELESIKHHGVDQKKLIQLDGITSSELRKLYSNCIALLIPSIYEGFGLPAAEAARCGALVLSATGSALDEIVGSTKFSFDLSMDNEINRILELGLLSHESNIERQKMYKRSFKFSWDLSTKKLLEIYDTVL